MANNHIDKGSIDAFTPTIVAQEAINYLREYSIMPALVSKNVGTEFREKGEVLTIPKYGNVTVRDKSANTDITIDKPNDDAVALTLNKHKYVAFGLEDSARAISGSGDILPGYAKQGLQRLADQVDADLLALITSTTDQVGSAGVAITPDMLIDARKELIDNNVPIQERKYAVISPKDEAYLLKQEKFTSAAWLDDAGVALKEASLGRRYGMDIFVDTQMPTSGSSPVTTRNVLFAPDAFVLAMRPLPIPPAGVIAADTLVDEKTGIAVRVIYSYDHKSMAVLCTIDVLYGCAVKMDEFAVEILS